MKRKKRTRRRRRRRRRRKRKRRAPNGLLSVWWTIIPSVIYI